MSDWPICKKCQKSILLHRLHGSRAYCTEDFGQDNMGTFSVREINQVRRSLGHKISSTAQAQEWREAK